MLDVELTERALLVVVNFLDKGLVSWYSKKQQSVSTSTAEAEYIAAGSCCASSALDKESIKRL